MNPTYLYIYILDTKCNLGKHFSAFGAAMITLASARYRIIIVCDAVYTVRLVSHKYIYSSDERQRANANATKMGGKQQRLHVAALIVSACKWRRAPRSDEI